jgi:hypothetical protein
MKKLIPLALVLAACGPAGVQPTLSSLQEELFTPRCSNTVCHGGANPARGLDLARETRANVVEVESTITGTLYVSPGNPDDSLLLQILLAPEEDIRQMPPGFVVDADVTAALEQWIVDGAPDN